MASICGAIGKITIKEADRLSALLETEEEQEWTEEEQWAIEQLQIRCGMYFLVGLLCAAVVIAIGLFVIFRFFMG